MATGGRTAWAAPLAICCLASTLFLIASTVVLALIPVYLSARNVQVNTNQRQANLVAGFASDLTDSSQLGAVTNPSDVSSQLFSQAGVSTTDNSLSNPNFASSQAAARRRRQFTNANGRVSCETTTGLSGDIFAAAIVFRFPLLCFTSSCQSSYRTNFINSLRKNYQAYTIRMTFTNITRVVTLKFCGIFTAGSSDCTSQTRNFGYVMDRNSNIYTFDPATRNISLIGNINCSTSSALHNIAVQRTGTLWATFEDGSLFRYNLASRVCSATTFAANQSNFTTSAGNQSNFTTYSMTFIKNPTDSGEVLYISSQEPTPGTLGRVDLNTFNITTFGNLNDSGASSALTSAADTGLYAVLYTGNYSFAQISKTNGTYLYKVPLSLNSTNATDPSFSVAGYNNVFYFFQADPSETTLYTLDKTTGALNVTATYNITVHGSTISSCYGT